MKILKNPTFGERAIAAVIRYERAASELSRIKKSIVTELEKCPITIEAYSDSGMESYGRGSSILWDGTRPNTHLHRALTAGLDSEEITDQLTGWDEDSEGACPRCLEAWRLIQNRSEARKEAGVAKRLIRALGKTAMKVAP